MSKVRTAQAEKRKKLERMEEQAAGTHKCDTVSKERYI